MARLACVDVPALPLQLLLRRHPEWKAFPAAVVAEEKAQGRILWVNLHARRRGVLPGMRHAAALSLTGDLRAGPVPESEIAAEVTALSGRLHRFSPHVEPCAGEPGLFWLDAGGLHRLHPSLQKWAERIRAALGETGFSARVVVGFSHFGCYAVARVETGVTLFSDAEAERRAAREVPLERLGIEPEPRDALHELGIDTLAELLKLPATGLLQRFGAGLYRLHRLAGGALAEPLQPLAERPPLREEIVLEYPEPDVTRLLFLLKHRLHFLLADLAARRESLRVLTLALTLDDESAPENVVRTTVRPAAPENMVRTAVRPAVPTRDAFLLLDLMRLRLEGLRLSGGVLGIVLGAEGAPSEIEQLSLFAQRPKRDLHAAEQALARLRAEFGEETVVRPVLREGHLPQARFTWEPLERLQPPRPAAERRTGPGSEAEAGPPPARSLVRRILARPLPLPMSGPLSWPLPAPGSPPSPDQHRRPPAAEHGELARDLGQALNRTPGRIGGGGTLRGLLGPYALSGGWWNGEQHRDYYFAETWRGEMLWLFHDRRRGRWFLQGRVE